VRAIYNEPYFPLELRHLFAKWIEERQWHTINLGTQAGIAQATQLMHEITRMMEQKKADLNASNVSVPKSCGLLYMFDSPKTGPLLGMLSSFKSLGPPPNPKPTRELE